MKLCAFCGKPVKDKREHLCSECLNYIYQQEEKEKHNDGERSKKITYYHRRQSYQG